MRVKSGACNPENVVSSPAAIRRRDVILAGPLRLEDARRRVASALNTSARRVSIESYRIGSSRWVLRCTGKADGTRFFAKIFLVDPFPVPPRFTTPWEELTTPEKPQRPVEEQVSVEWRMVREMRALVGSDSIPAPLGYSTVDRTLVFAEVRGTRLDRFAGRAWPSSQRTQSTEKAVFNAGGWLRALHDSSPHECETVEFRRAVNALGDLIRRKRLQGTLYARWTTKVIESLGQRLSPRTSLHIPVALNHGDFSFPNLIWDPQEEHLWVVDFELSARKAILHDLCTMIFELRKALLYPHTSRSTVRAYERAFWAGYGAISEDLFMFVNALATARLFYWSFPRILTLPQRRGWRGWLKATLYKRFFERYAAARILQGAGC